MNNFKVGSHPYQVVELTKRIERLTAHLKNFRKDNVSKLSLFKLVSKRKRFLKYIKRRDFEAYQILTTKKKS
ncbi:30S ribosomal protein S15 [Candidatus Mycoplasma haematobovis]|uniref:30S ribosomal protein S15 n=1 Tax=Candidatus Mycoplasma haematobovis TaxID=432608 RepID=A0A1A9QCV3_9MOLU|nr:30S ribosomal protein S15 [Candidatus Mycoplasma haematobovis]OAL10297.1 30S ribosomal protein S15 [Candidatus Mycoplasma haematobovis]